MEPVKTLLAVNQENAQDEIEEKIEQTQEDVQNECFGNNTPISPQLLSPPSPCYQHLTVVNLKKPSTKRQLFQDRRSERIKKMKPVKYY